MTHRGRILFATLLLLAGTAQAGVSVLGGVTLPRQNWDLIADAGPHVGLEITVPLIPSLLSVGGQTLLSRNELATADLPYAVPDDLGGRWYTGELLAIGKLQLPLTGLHARVGLGIIDYRYDAEGALGDDYEGQTRWVAAVGAGFALAPLEIQAMYHVVKWDEDAEVPETLDDVDTDYSLLTVSAAFGF